MNNMLTTKEVGILAELLTQEALVCKKAGLYSRVLTDQELVGSLAEIAEVHRNNFKSLEELF